MYDEILLAMFANGFLKVCPQTLRAWNWHRGKRHWIEKKWDYHRDRARFKLHIQGRRVTIYRNRLIYLWVHRRAPDVSKEVIDHKDLDRTNDSPENLQTMRKEESVFQGHLVRQQKAIKEIGDWFMEQGIKDGFVPSI